MKRAIVVLLTVVGLAVIGDEMVSMIVLALITAPVAGRLLKELSEHY